jgi:hypothetical protein
MLFTFPDIPDNIEEPKHFIGIDDYEKDSLSYCLCRKINDKSEVLLIKTMSNEEAFNKEVENLSKHFNAKVIREA